MQNKHILFVFIEKKLLGCQSCGYFSYVIRIHKPMRLNVNLKLK